ncbi:MAG: diguanylate cyclase [Mycobacterium sp.]
MTFLRQWWTEPVPTGWLLAFLQTRKLDRVVRLLIAGYALIFAAICLTVQFSDAGPTSTVGRVIVGVCGVGALGWAARWAFWSWPTLAVSVAFVAFADLGTALSCSQDSNNLAGLVGTVLFTPIGAYVSFFLGNRLLIAHAALCTAVIFALAIPMVAEGTIGAIATAVTKVVSLLMVVVLIPVVIQFGIAVIRLDALASRIDPLTGILNRRGIHYEWQRLHTRLTRLPNMSGNLAVAVASIDIDRFKSINDTQGHSAGDQVLIAVARALTAQSISANIVGRSGGEEFIVASVCTAESVPALAAALGEAVSGCSHSELTITASVGVATRAVSDLATSTADEAIESLMVHADNAMYTAKYDGGNQYRITEALHGDDLALP